ncbi:hypothetical protein [Gaetbulibacter saemankumensis]|uniref:hypothetical protein n=1 Tax=Gaetbulibacter saemankumensis TaxID=311208 RepID=UPI00040BCD58|nr:hypothetical protein [Gaetbulibacter saemankumensis]
MNSTFKFIAFLLAITFLNCKQKETFQDFKYSDKKALITCPELNSQLFNEALYSFEDDILNYYKSNRSNTTLVQAYNLFVRDATGNRAKYDQIISKHSLNVFEALKNENNLWDANNPSSHLNYNGPLLECISINMQNKHLKTTLNALISTNSMSPKLFGAPLSTQYRQALSDKYLATYIAFDLYYAKLFGIDFSKVNFDKPESAVDFNQTPKK